MIDAADAPEAHAVAARCRPEFVITVEGDVARRLPGMENPRMATGEIELQARDLTILAEARTPPFYINEPDAPVDESVRLQYRYLDIRREPMLRRLLLRSKMVAEIRRVHEEHGFVEIETPILIKSTPEGARDFIVPSRMQPGTVYALPQSPQQLKQLLMVAGMDRYYQIARCFRDEDLRGDRQPEFTQLDLEMSFVAEGTVMDFVETMAIAVSRAVAPDRPLQDVPFPRFTYDEALERFVEEAKITAQLDHPNIPPVYALSTEKKKSTCFTMKVLEGSTLLDILFTPAAFWLFGGALSALGWVRRRQAAV